jgi:hypothetical protein
MPALAFAQPFQFQPPFVEYLFLDNVNCQECCANGCDDHQIMPHGDNPQSGQDWTLNNF